MLTYWRPRIKDQGALYQHFSSGNIGTVTANVASVFGMGGMGDVADTQNSPGHTGYIDDIIVGCITVPIDADGTVLLTVTKYDASAAAAVVLTGSFDMELLVSGKAKRVPLLTTLTDAQRIIDVGDYLYCTITNNSAAIDTQMVGGTVRVHVKMLN